MRLLTSARSATVRISAINGVWRRASPLRPLATKIVAFFSIVVVALSVSTASDSVNPPIQQPNVGPSYAEEVAVTVANLDVFVRDREGRPVEGLVVEDFRVILDGVEKQISNFTAFTPPLREAVIRPTVVGMKGWETEKASRRIQPLYVILHFDNENLQPILRNRVLNQLSSFVEETLEDQVRIMVVSSRRKLEIVQPFTEDSDMVLGAVQRVANEGGALSLRNRERRRILNRMKEFDAIQDTFGQTFSDGVPPRVTMVQVRAQLMNYTEEEFGVLRDTLASMHEAVRLVSCMAGRRSIVFVSAGLPMTPDLGLMHEFATVFRDNTIYARIRQRDYSKQFRGLANAANREGVSLYTIDARGLNPLKGLGGENKYMPEAAGLWAGVNNPQKPLSFLAEETGGIAVVNTNNVSRGLQLIRNDLFSYYSLGYKISSNTEDTAHHIKVELPRHPDYAIRYRKWFIEKSLESRVQELVVQTLEKDLGHNPMDLHLIVGDPAPTSGKHREIPLRLSFPIRNLILEAEAGDLVGQIELFFCVRDARGHGSPTRRREYEVRIPAALFASERAQRYEISVQMLFKPQQHTLAVGLVDRVSRQTSYTRTVIPPSSVR